MAIRISRASESPAVAAARSYSLSLGYMKPAHSLIFVVEPLKRDGENHPRQLPLSSNSCRAERSYSWSYTEYGTTVSWVKLVDRINTWNPLFTAAMIFFGLLVQRKGLGC